MQSVNNYISGASRRTIRATAAEAVGNRVPFNYAGDIRKQQHSSHSGKQLSEFTMLESATAEEGRRGLSRSESRRRGERGFITKPLPEKRASHGAYSKARPFKVHAKHVAGCRANHVAQHASQLAIGVVTIALAGSVGLKAENEETASRIDQGSV